MNKHYIGKRVSSIERYDELGAITGVAVIGTDDGEYLAGNDSGYVLEVFNPYASQEMANDLLTQMRGKTYKGYRAQAADLDMSAELGDGITVDGIYSMLAYQNVTFGPGHMSEMAAPGESTLDHEYPYVSQTQRQIRRQGVVLRSEIKKTDTEIRLLVENTEEGLQGEITQTASSINTRITDEVKGLNSSITQTATTINTRITNEISGVSSQISQTANNLSASISAVDGRLTSVSASLDGVITRVSNAEGDISALEQTATSLSTRISNAEGDISSVEQTATSLTTRISNAEGDISSVEQTVGGLTTRVANAETGLSQTLRIAADGVTITNAAGSRTTIDGGQINAKNLNLTGVISFSSDLDSASQQELEALKAAAGKDLPDYIKETYIDSTEIRSPLISALRFSLGTSGQTGQFDFQGDHAGTLATILRIAQLGTIGQPTAQIYSPVGGRIAIGNPVGSGEVRIIGTTYFPGVVHFGTSDVFGYVDMTNAQLYPPSNFGDLVRENIGSMTAVFA